MLAHHMHHPDPAQAHTSAVHRLEPEHRPHSPFDRPMILLNAIVQVGTSPDQDRLQLASRPILNSICRVAGQDRLAIGLAAVNDDALGPAMPLEGLTQEPLGGCQISPFAKPKFNRIAVAVDCTIEMPP